eukprot:gene16858-20028_t
MTTNEEKVRRWTEAGLRGALEELCGYVRVGQRELRSAGFAAARQSSLEWFEERLADLQLLPQE